MSTSASPDGIDGIDDDTAAAAAEPLDATDAALLAAVRRVATAADPVPTGLVDDVSFAVTVELLHAEVARLTRDDELALSAVRGEEDRSRSWSLNFDSDSASIVLVMSPVDAGRVRVDGWVVPGAAAAVDTVGRNPRESVSADDNGHFVFDGLARGRVGFTIRGCGESAKTVAIAPFAL